MRWSAPLAGAELLDDADRRRLAELRRPDDRARFATGRTLLREALAAELGVEPATIALHTRCPICGGPHGRPRLANPRHDAIDFSIAHAGDRVVVATCRDAAVGVDVEPIRPAGELTAPAAGVLAMQERCDLHGRPADQRDGAFMRYWTRKEAVLKATGDGLTVALDRLHVSPPDAPPAVLAWPAPLHRRTVRMLDLDTGPGYRACVAVLTAGEMRWTVLTPAAAATTAAARPRSR